MCIIFFCKDYRESGLKLIYLEEETDFLEGEFVTHQFQNLKLQKRFARHLGVDEKAMKVCLKTSMIITEFL